MATLFRLPKPVVVDSGGTPYAGAKATFYKTGTTTKTDVYTDAALSVAHSNPVVANAAGVFAPIWLDPEVTYKLTLTDANDVLIYTVDPVSDSLTADNIGAILYAKTPAETTAGVTPVNLRYDFDVIDRFATNTTPGTTDMSTAFSNADTVGLTHIRVRNGVHRISSDTTIDAVLIFEGTGQISVDSGVTFTCGGVVGDPATVYFKGSGKVKTKNNYYSVGWFDGSDASAKWDFCRRGFSTNTLYTVFWPRPHSGDSAATTVNIPNVGSITGWKATGSMTFNDPENNGTVICDGAFICTDTVDGVLEFSGANKVENVIFPNGISIYGDGNGDKLIYIRGGSRIQFRGKTTLYDSTGVCLQIDLSSDDENASVSEVIFEFLETTGYQTFGVLVNGDNSNGANANRIEFLFSNGAGATTADNLVKIKGKVSNFRIENVFLSVATGTYHDVGGDANISFEATTNGRPYACGIGSYHQKVSAVKPIECIDGSSGTADKCGVDIGRVAADNLTTGPLITFEWADNCTYHGASDAMSATRALEVEVTADCSGISLYNVDVTQVALTSQSITDNGYEWPQRLRVNGDLGFYAADMPDDKVASMRLSTANPYTGRLLVACEENSAAYLQGIARNSGDIIATDTGASASKETGALTDGTSDGTDARMCVSLSSGILYVKNRLGQARSFVARAS